MKVSMPYIATLAFSQSAEKKGVRRTMYNEGERVHGAGRRPGERDVKTHRHLFLWGEPKPLDMESAHWCAQRRRKNDGLRREPMTDAIP